MIWVRDCLSLWSRVLQICCRFTQWSVTLTTVWLLTCWLERASRHPRAGCRERVGRHRDTGKLGSAHCSVKRGCCLCGMWRWVKTRTQSLSAQTNVQHSTHATHCCSLYGLPPQGQAPAPTTHKVAVLLYSRLGRINRSTPLMDLGPGIVVGRISPSRHYFFEMASPLKVPPVT